MVLALSLCVYTRHGMDGPCTPPPLLFPPICLLPSLDPCKLEIFRAALGILVCTSGMQDMAPPEKKDNVKQPSIHPAGSSMLFLPFLPFSLSHNCAVDLHMAYPWHVNGVETTLIISFPFHARLLLLPSPRCQCLCLHRFRNPGQRKW